MFGRREIGQLKNKCVSGNGSEFFSGKNTILCILRGKII